jgi:hypothetical protein
VEKSLAPAKAEEEENTNFCAAKKFYEHIIQLTDKKIRVHSVFFI